TIKTNLKNFDTEENRLVVDKVYFNDRVKKYNPWNVIIAVDESGSMLDSVIHSAIMAGIFSKLPMLKTNLVIFDTEVVDLSGYIDEPVETLMSVQLGGGTNITKALQYCETLIENPHRTMVILVTDLYEGYGYGNMYATAKSIIESGAKLIVLTALDMEATPIYDKNAAQKMASLGAEVGAMTPGGLSEWIAKIIS
ncbi:MAG: VWA domain-containing protein, partial [Clostridium sp.]